MTRQVIGRAGELGAIADFLTSACVRPSGLTIEGAAGIGKTTLWSAAVDQAHEQGLCVLSARAGQAETAMSYAVLADLLSDVESSVVARLPELQRVTVDRVLMRSGHDGPEISPRVVAAAVMAIVEILAEDAPLVLAIDDLQWLDAPSRAVVAFVARRIKGRVSVLVTERPEPGRATAMTWLRVGARNNLVRILLGPLNLDGVHALVSSRLGRSLPRPTISAIAEVSHGNGFYALELARATDSQSPTGDQELPRTLSGLVASRVGDLDADVRAVLLAAACVTNPTLDLLAQTLGITTGDTVKLLETAESRDIVSIEGNRVRFTHPIFARGVYTGARPSLRRQMHRALAKVEAPQEAKARHLALAATSQDPATLEALDAAAESARARGAPAVAAELVDLAIGLGGDTPLRRIRSSRYHFHAGNYGYARTLLEPCIRDLPPGRLRATAVTLLAEMRMHHNSFAQATEMLRGALTYKDVESDSALIVQILTLLAFAQLSTGEYDESLHNATRAAALTDELDLRAFSSQACAMQVTAKFMCGHGVDIPRLGRALDLEDRYADVAVPLDAGTVNALVLAWTGRLDEARTQMSSVRERCAERGEYDHLMFVDLHSTMIEVWRGNFTEAEQTARTAMERAKQLGGGHALVMADTVGAVVAAYAGRERKARAHARAAIEKASRCDSPYLAEKAITSLGFLEVSLGNNAEAVATLQPLVDRFNTLPGTEIATAAFLPDAIEAMIALGRLDEAEPLIEVLEHHGQQFNRAWTQAIGARCRSMMFAAQGQLLEATSTAQQAMTAHQRLPMPFERARTQLLLGQLQRRQRQKDGATATLTEALTTFEEMKTVLWIDRTRNELARTRVSPTRAVFLTPSEQRVAELAASGMTIRAIAAAVFISPKTVGANLARIYRKLGIHSRAELGRVIQQQAEAEPHHYPNGAHG